MKKIIIRGVALFASCCTAALIDLIYFTMIKGNESVYSNTQLFYFECLTIGLSIFAFLYTYSFYKQKLQDLW